MNGRAWTGKEVWHLMGYAEKASQRTAARLLGRSVQSVSARAKRDRTFWRKGSISATAVARKVGCSATTAQRVADEMEFKAVGSGNGRRFLLTPEQAQWLEDYLVRRLRKNAQQRAAAKLRYERKRTQ